MNMNDDRPINPLAGTNGTSRSSTSTNPPPNASSDTSTQLGQHQRAIAAMQQSIVNLTVDARTARESNARQIDNLQSVLNTILQRLPDPSTAAATSGSTTTTTADAASGSSTASTQPMDTAEDNVATNTVSEASFSGFQSASNHGSVTERVADLSMNSGSTIRRQTAQKLHSLPQFSGAPEQWPKFIQRFRQTTEAYGYSAMDNSLRLQDCLVGEALEAVDGMLNDGTNTEQAIEELESRFGRPELLAQMQLQRVREVMPIPETRPELLVPFYSRVFNMLVHIDVPQTREYLCNPELLEQLVQILPMSRRHAWSEHAEKIKPAPRVRDFVAWLKPQARRIGLMTPAATLAAATLPLTTTTTMTRQPPPRTAATYQRRDRLNHVATNESFNCGICDGRGHSAEMCRRFLDLNANDRWNTVREKHVCFSCLCPGHGVQECNRRTACGIENCRRPHNQLLHAPTTQRVESPARQNPFASNRGQVNTVQSIQPSAAAQPADRNIDDVIDATSQNPASEIDRINTSQNKSPNTIYRIIPVTLYAADRSVTTFAFLDDGSSVTAVVDSLADELGLSGPKTALELHWFDGKIVSHCQARHQRHTQSEEVYNGKRAHSE